MILALDTSTAACSVALFGADGRVMDSRREPIGRGHAERLVPMIAEVMNGRRADTILVGCGPGSFTGLRVGIAAAHGLAIGWDCTLLGMSSLALIASPHAPGPVAAVIAGGHGELFVQTFFGDPLAKDGNLSNLPPEAAAAATHGELLAGPAAEQLLAVRGRGRAVASWPDAADALRLPPALRSLDPRPIYARAPDARPRAAA